LSSSFPLEFILNVKNNMSAGVNQATGELQKLGTAADQTGQKAKSSGMGIGAAFQFTALNAFNLATSLIQTKRSYEDLGKAEAQQQSKREAVIKTTNKLENAEIALFKARKSGDPLKIAKAENNLANAKLNVEKATRNEKLGQIELNRAHEDFYLNIIPNVISGIGTMAGVMQVFKGVTITAGGALRTFVFPLAAITAGVIALKTNFLGITDFFQNLGRDIGNAVPALKPFLNLIEALFSQIGIGPKKSLNKAAKEFMDSFKPIIDSFKSIIDAIMKGNWEGAFNVIKNAAIAFWEDLKKKVPFFGGLALLIDAIRKGSWEQAFDIIKAAAIKFWNDLKTKVPFLADVENFIKSLMKGDWAGVFAAIMSGWQNSGLPGMIENFFGKNWKSGLEAYFASLQGQWGLLKESIENQDWEGAFNTIKDAVKTSGLQDALNIWNLIFGGVGPGALLPATDPKMQGKFAEIATAIGTGLSLFAKNALDPFLASFFKPETWVEGVKKVGAGIAAVIFDAIFPKDKGGGRAAITQMSTNFMVEFFKGIGLWINENFPTTIAAFGGMTTAITEVATGASTSFVDFFVKGIPNAVKAFAGEILKAAGSLGQELLKSLQEFFTVDNVGRVITAILSAMRSAVNSAKSLLTDFGKYIANRIWHAITSGFGALAGGAGQLGSMIMKALGFHASGFHGFTSGPTAMVVGERGAEHVDVTPMNDWVNRRNKGGGGMSGSFSVTVPVFLDGRQIAEVVANRMSQDQGVQK
jgi:hypothetical protein